MHPDATGTSVVPVQPDAQSDPAVDEVDTVQVDTIEVDPAARVGAPSVQAERAWRDFPSHSQTPPDVLNGRFTILDVAPCVESGRRPAKAAVGELITVTATAFREGHDLMGVNVVLRDPEGNEGPWTPMTLVSAGMDLWEGEIRPHSQGDWTFTIEAWADPIATWLHRALIMIPAGIDVELECLEGAIIFERALAQMTSKSHARAVEKAIKKLRSKRLSPAKRLAAITAEDVTDAIGFEPLRDLVTESGPWPLRVDRRRALVGSWYEMFPRSEGAKGKKSGTFSTAAKRFPAIAEMGFDVIYVPPIHPVGRLHRKGPNNSTEHGPSDPGSPWAIGAKEGGHWDVHPDLGTLADFDAFVKEAASYNLEISIDLALQVAPDHPWATGGKPWFNVRGDGTIAYAENPPKKYQDIYPIWFDGDPQGLHDEVVGIIRFWAAHGIRIFRVDNPHTKPVRFWDRVLADIHLSDPDILFLAEAFTRPPMMRAIAEVGFHQSYSYFTWRNEKWEIEQYFTELSGPASAYMRPNLFVNTPDILTSYLQYGGPAAFAIRATLAATLAPTWGMYAGFELYEHVAVKPGSEEYLDSEKYQLRARDWDAADKSGQTLAPYITMLNTVRRRHRALQTLRGITFHEVDNEKVIAYSRRDGDDIVVVICTLDPYGAQEATVHFDMAALGLDVLDEFLAHDHITQRKWIWSPHTYVRLDPFANCAHIATISREPV